ncbi:MAG TPA: VOC family protein [Candidatus Saccharimonadaceae bacterium]|jgi:PhnB protein|nr:VOC family protein [Candidatus Saccharimonadaceae bacterium]
MANVKPIPEGFHSITPSLVVKDAKKAIEFYKTALGATEKGGPMLGPDGKVMHAELKIGNSIIFIGEESLEMGAKSPQTLGGSPGALNIYTEDVDALFKRAIAAGATATMPVADQFWGDRYGQLTDPFGHRWGIGTHKEDLTEAQMMVRMKEFFAQMAGAEKK